MRAALVGIAALLVTASLAGCLERRGTLAVQLLVSGGGGIEDFQSLNITLDKVRIKARTLNPEDQPAATPRVELVDAAVRGQPVPLFAGEVRSDRYDRITLIPPTGQTFRGFLLDGTQVAVIFEPVTQETNFEVPRGGAVTYEFALRVVKNVGAGGVPDYRIVASPEESGPR